MTISRYSLPWLPRESMSADASLQARHTFSPFTMLRPLTLPLLLLLAAFLCPTSAYDHPFQDLTLPTPDRITNLLSLLNLTQKLSLLYTTTPSIPHLSIDRFDFGQECLHGLVNRRSDLSRDGRATAFPQSIGLAASWNVSMMAGMGGVISDEARGKRNGRLRAGNSTRSNELTYLMCWTPVVNIQKDPRWGRSAETYGESPLLTYKLTSALLSGLYGSDDTYVKIAPVLKHYTVYDGPEQGRFGFNALVKQADMYDTFTYVYRSLIEEQPSRVRGLMASYSAYNGVPVAADFDLLTKQPVFDWGWRDGHIVSDCDAVNGIWNDHHYAADAKSAAALSLLAGMDLDCGNAFDSLGDAIDDGIIGEPDIDAALAATINIQMMVGFYDPFGLSPFDNISEAVVDSPPHRQAALEAAHQSVLLLQNNANILPLNSTTLRRIAVIGPTANDTAEYEACTQGSGGSCLLLHIYHAYTEYLVQPLVGLQENVAGSGVEVVYARGCERYGDNHSGFEEAMAAAKGSDVIVYVGGLDYLWEEEDTDRTDLQLPAIQQQLLTRLATLHIPIVSVLLHGGALSDDIVDNVSSAILSCGYPGQSTGLAIANILFGAVNPSAKLPYTVYKDTSQLPPIGDYHMTDGPGRTYRFFNSTPRHYFGDGLSYTTFHYTNLTTTIDPTGQHILAAVTVANVGAMDGSEVVQLYAGYDAGFVGVDEAAVVELSVPRRQLLAFDKRHVRRGESVVVQFNVSVSQLTAFGRWTVPTSAALPVDESPLSSLRSRPLTEQEVRVLASGFRAERQRLEARRTQPVQQTSTAAPSVTLPVWLSLGGCQPTIERIAAGVVLVQQITVTALPQLVPQSDVRTNERLLNQISPQSAVLIG